jgi:hypothetical protein
MIKMHKHPAGLRFIAGANNVFNTDPHKHLAMALKVLDRGSITLLNKARRRIPFINCTQPINMDNTMDAINGINFYNRNKDHSNMTEMQTADVVRLYTNLPLELVYAILEEYCKRLWIEGHYLVIKPELKEGKWSKKHIPDKENTQHSLTTWKDS